MMNVEFDEHEVIMQKMQEEWNNRPDAFYLDHYKLAEKSNFSALKWREFLCHPKVVDWLNQEMTLVQQSKLRLLIRDLDEDSRSVGLSQLINTLSSRLDKKEKVDTGPIFIYTMVPLNEQEEHAPNVAIAEDYSSSDITEF